MRRSIESLKYMGSKYFRDNLFQEEEEKIEVDYNKNHLQIGTCVEDGSIYTIDLTDGIKLLIAGLSGCMPKGTLVKVPEGYKPIEECKNVLSYNFDKKTIENKKCIVHPSGKKKVVKIKTSEGVMVCSPEHKWFVKRNGKRIVVQTKDLLKTDKLLRYKYGEN